MVKRLANDPVIISAQRSPIGRHGGSLAALRPDDMLAALIKKSVERLRIDPHDIDEVVIGCANQAGEDNRNVARMALLLAGLPHSVPGLTVNRLCASGLDAIIAGARAIITKEAKLIIAGGVESMSRAPYVMAKAKKPFELGTPQIHDSSLGWRFFNEAMRDRTPPEANGVTAERLAEHFKISRERQDRFALRSHELAIAAHAKGLFRDEIVPLLLPSPEKALFEKDEGPRPDTSLERLASLRPAFQDGGTVTAGNSSALNDGASVVVIASHDLAKSLGVMPLARILGFASAGVDPRVMGIGPVPATKKLMTATGLFIDDFSSVEINEAFAAQVLAVVEELKIEEGRVNPRGGAIALGHPLGCSGARIATTLVHTLRSRGGALGLASLCVGVGQGVSMAVEAI